MNALALLLFFAAADVRLPYTLVRLDNGATVVLQQDTSMPQVGVEVWIRGGAREEAPGQHGTAHLFEHDLPASGRFLGNADNRAQRSATSREGGAGTQYDFLRFYATASPDGLEPALGYLADRLESDPAKFSDENVKRDQDIVVSELRRSMNVDWDLEVRNALARGTFGAGHPYGHAIGGSETDVRAANAESMREWHRRFAGAANAIVFIVGNFDPARAEALARHHLGSIPPGRRAPRISEDVPNARTRRETLEKDVPQPLTYIAWPVPGWGTADADRLSLLARVLGDRETRAELELWEMAGALTLRGNDEAKLRQALKRDVTAAELARAKTRLQTDFVRTLQRPVWRGSRADVLGFGLMFRDDPDHYRKSLARIANTTLAQLHAARDRWLATPGYTLEVVPQPKRVAAPPIDRAASVTPVEAKPVEFPPIERGTLGGFPALTIARKALPLAQYTIAFEGRDAATLVAAEALQALLGEPAEIERDADFTTLSLSVLSGEDVVASVQSALARELPDDVFGAAKKRAAQQLAGDAMQQRAQALECVIAGDCKAPRVEGVSKADVRRVLESRPFIVASGDVPRPSSGAIARAAAKTLVKGVLSAPNAERFLIVDHPSATQAHILLAQVLPAEVANDPLAAQLVVSHAFRSRLMDNLRSAKGWSYESYPFGIELRRGGAVARFNMPVQTDKTAEAIAEVRKEIARLRDEPVTPASLRGWRSYLESTLTAGLMSLERLNPLLLDAARNELPPGYYASALRRLAAFTPEDVTATARALFRPDRLVWVIAGRRDEVERELRELGVPFEVYAPQ